MKRVSPEERERLLATVSAASERREAAEAKRAAADDAWRAAILAAHEAGVPVTHIASSAGLSRQYVHRIIAA